EEKGRLFVRVYGRTAGEVRLWRAGQWLEPVEPSGGPLAPRPGRQIYEWWIEPEVAAGDYLMTVYGARPLRWTSGDESNLLHVASGFDEPGAPRAAFAELPAWGSLVYGFQGKSALAHLARAGRSEVEAALQLHGAAKDGPRQPRGGSACSVAPKALVPQCAARSSGGDLQIVAVRGEPGTPVRVQWGLAGSVLIADGEY